MMLSRRARSLGYEYTNIRHSLGGKAAGPIENVVKKKMETFHKRQHFQFQRAMKKIKKRATKSFE